MTVAGRINLTVAIVTLLAGCLAGALFASHQYRTARHQLLDDIDAALGARPQLQADIYLRDTQRLQAELQTFLDLSPAVRFAAILDNDGLPLVQSAMDDVAQYSHVPFAAIRDGASAVDASLVLRPAASAPEEGAVVALLTGGEELLFSATPIFSLLNPTRSDLGRIDFGLALASPARADSRYVIGYLELVVSRSILIASAIPPLGNIVGFLVVFTVAALLVTRLVTGRLTRPLEQLAAAAEGIAAGNQQQALRIRGSTELERLAAALNSVIDGLSNYKTRTDVDQTLLRMKVDERTAQLSRRNKELNVAVRQVTQAKDRLRYMAYYDSLTSLPNRRLFSEQLGLLLRLSKRNGQMLALLFLDLDNFKRINDSLGHSAGDLLLKEVATRLSSCVRDSDVVAHFEEAEQRLGISRLGGDEFTLVLNQLDDPRTAGLVAERLLAALLEPITVAGHEVVVTPSIGIAVSPRDGEDLESLLKAADTAMYHAKHSGKGSYLFYDPQMDAAGVERLQLETDLRKAIDNEQLLFHYQPQVDTRSGTVVGVEALLRWRHPERGFISPGMFIPLAEEMGLIPEIGAWGLRQACRDLARLRDEGFALGKMAVNVSALQFCPGFGERVLAALRDNNLPPGVLSLELTEGIAMDSSDFTLRTLHELQARGVRLSIDDFGTGYSSLSYLNRFPLNELKIDRSFVTGVESNEQQSSLVSAIIAMGKSLQLDLVAEGVETADQYHYLTRSGARVIQGYLFSRPMPLEELKPLLDRGHFAGQIMAITGVINEVGSDSLVAGQ